MKACYLVLLALAFVAHPTRTLADIGVVEDAIFNWLVDGVSPQHPTNPYCATDGGYLLGHVTGASPDSWIEEPLAALCQAQAKPRTGELPLFVYACYTTDPIMEDFDVMASNDRLCFCDYYLCNPEHQQPLEDSIDFAVSLVEFLDL